MDKTSISSVNKKVEDNMAERMISEVGLRLTRTMKNEAVHSLVESLECPFLLCPVLSCVPSRILAVPACPVPWQDFWLVPLSLCPRTMKELLSHCPEKLHCPCPVPLETLVETSYIGTELYYFEI